MPDSQNQGLPVQSIENPQPAIPPTKPSSTSNNKRLIIILVSFLLVLAIGAVVIYYLVKPNASLPVFLPVRLDHPAVKQAYIDYDFRVQVKEVKEEAGKKRIITNINGKNIPEFIVDNKTLVVFNAVGEEQSVPFPKSSNLKDEKISIIARYYLNSKSWRVAKITLYSPEGVTTIPSSRSNKK